jgi:septum formation protein
MQAGPFAATIPAGDAQSRRRSTAMDGHRLRLVLASASPRRRELLAQAGYEFIVVPPRDEAERGPVADETVEQLVTRLAYQKAADVVGRVDADLVVGCDTVVQCQGEILGKPRDRHDAERMLRLLRGQKHHVYSGLCLWRIPTGMYDLRIAVTTLVMAPISDAQVDQYLKTGQWRGKAGAFGYQDGHDWLHVVNGSESNVVGLPLELLSEMIEAYPKTT